MQITRTGLTFSGTLTQEESDALDLAASLNPAETLETTVTGYVAHILADAPARQEQAFISEAKAAFEGDPTAQQEVADTLSAKAQQVNPEPPIQQPKQ